MSKFAEGDPIYIPEPIPLDPFNWETDESVATDELPEGLLGIVTGIIPIIKNRIDFYEVSVEDREEKVILDGNSIDALD